MMTNSVRLTEVLRQMEEGEEPFSIRFVTANRSQQTGGRIEHWHGCRLSRRRQGPGAAAPAPPAAETPGRLPSHFVHSTRNVVQGSSTQVRKIHIWLLLEFNGQRVIL